MRNNSNHTVAAFLATAFVILAYVVLSLSSCGSSYDTNSIGREIPVPEGYSLIAVSSFGKYGDNPTFYCQNDTTSRVYICDDGIVQDEIIVPDGYTLVAVSAYGQYGGNYTYYCQNNETGQVFACDLDRLSN